MTDRMLKYHPLANAFPMLTGAELKELIDDIRANGIQCPIVMYQGKILDGRNRYTAARKAHHAMTGHDFEQFNGTWAEAARYVVSLNLIRRNLTESQRAMCAARLAAVEQPEPIETETSATEDSRKSTSMSRPIGLLDAAVRLNVSGNTARAARKVQQQGVDELGKAVDEGTVRVSAAARIADLPKAEQEQIVAGGPVRIRRTATNLLNDKRARKDKPADKPADESAPQPQRDCLLHERLVNAAHEFVTLTRLLVTSDETTQPTVIAVLLAEMRRALDDLEALAAGSPTDDGLSRLLDEK